MGLSLFDMLIVQVFLPQKNVPIYRKSVHFFGLGIFLIIRKKFFHLSVGRNRYLRLCAALRY